MSEDFRDDPQDDELLRELGARVREDRQAEARELEELERTDEGAARLEEAFRPTDDAFRRRLAAGALERIEAANQSPAGEGGTIVRGSFRAPTLRLLALAAILLLAVGLLSQLRGPKAEGDWALLSAATERRRSIPEARGGAVTNTEAPLELRADDELFLSLGIDSAPETIPAQRASLFLRDAEGGLHALAIEHEDRSPGRLELRARMDAGVDAEVGAGPATLVVALHPSRTISVEQVRGSVSGRWADLWHGSWQRLELPVRVTAEDRTVKIEFSGCGEVRGPLEEPTCVLDEGHELRLWVAATGGAEPIVALGSHPVSPGTGRAFAGQPAAGGFVFLLDGLGSELGMVEIRPSEGGEPVRRLRIGAPEDDTDTAARRLDAREIRHRAHLAFTEGELEECAELLRESARLHGELGALSTHIDDLALLFHVLFERLGRISEARAVLGSLPAPAWGDGQSAFLLAFNRGTWALEAGQPADALLHLSEAARHAERIGSIGQRNMAEQQLMRILRRLGRGGEAEGIRERLAEEVHLLPACQKPSLVNNLAWDRLQTWEAAPDSAHFDLQRPGKHDPEPTIRLLQEALDFVDRCDQPLDEERSNLHLNLALAHWHGGEPGTARAHLDAAHPDAALPSEEQDPALPPRLRAWYLELEARLALEEGRPAAALGAAQGLATLAHAIPDADAGWRSARLAALASEALGNGQAVLAALADAESWLDQIARGVPLDVDRATSLAVRGRSTGVYLDQLLAAGEVERAFRAARHARVRLYRGAILGAAPALLETDELEAWLEAVWRWRSAASSSSSSSSSSSAAREARRLEELAKAARAPLDRQVGPLGWPTEGLPELDPRELVLLFHPLEGEAWVGFGARGGAVQAHRFDRIEAADLVAPFLHSMAGAEQVRILPLGALAELDFHALDVGGEPLAERLPVIYGLDLPPLPSSSLPIDAAPEGSGRIALLLADPGNDLPAAEAELASVRRALDDWRFLAPEVASAPGLVAALDGVDLFHFAGHADFAGHDGLESHLRLRGTGRLSAADLLSSEVRTPELVVLSACASARSSVDAHSPGLGLAHAFLLRGSRRVLGATEPVADRLGQRFMEHFYGAWDGTAEGAPEALRAAQSALRGETAGTTDDRAWRAFRLLSR